MPSDFKYYPYPDEPSFNEKIYKKKEFYINRTKKVDKSKKIDELMKEKCTGFKLSDNQKFLKTFMSSNTPYNGLLLFHGTGVGKTCSSISIAEQYSEVLEKYNKKIIILLNPSIEDNFRKNIFNPGTLKTKKITQQCLGDKYLKKIKSYKNRDFTREDLTDDEIDKVTRKIDNRIKAKYRFQGYQEFSNKLVKLKEKLSSRKGAYEKRLKEFFSNTVLIIDEAHNIKDTTEGKMIPKVLDEVLSNADEMKLILLSATPMFNEPQEIVFLLNLLLKNDRREEIDASRVFNPDGSLLPDGQNILAEKSQGIVSYLRGENPLAFPLRFDPHPETAPILSTSQFPEKDSSGNIIPSVPKKDYSGNDIPIDQKLKHLKLIPCVMEGHQKKFYNKMADQGFGSFDNDGVSVSDIVFPGEEDANYQSLTTNNGFDKNFKKTGSGENISFAPITSDAEKLLKLKNLKQFSTKMYSVIKSISESKTDGIIFVYSRFVKSGVVMLGMLLEMEGFKNTNGNLLKGNYGQETRGDKAKYMIISGDQELSKNSYLKYIKNESKNKEGKKLKVILGSESASEGLDFKYIREVHILDPWPHLNKIEQVIGRGIRYCSHIELTPEKRNVTVFMYVATLSDDPSKDNETADLKIYRSAENKDKNMADITYILKQNAVDCNLNLNSNKFTDEYFTNEGIEMVDSKGKKREITYRDAEKSRLCNYRECDFKCIPHFPPNKDLKPEEIDTDTFDTTVVVENINQIIEIVKDLFLGESILELDEIANDNRVLKMNVDERFVQTCLDIMVKNEMLLRDKFDNIGRVLSRGKYYLFAPSYITTDKISLREIKRPVDVVENRINLTKDLQSLKSTHDLILKEESEKVQTSDIDNLLDELDLEPERIHYMPNNIKELILKSLIKNDLDKKDDLYTKFYTNKNLNLNFNILRENDIYNVKKSKDNKIIGYFLVEGSNIKIMEYSRESGKFTPADGDYKKLVLSHLRRKISEKKTKTATVLSYMEQRKDKLVLKVMDTTGEEGKSKKSQSSGIVLTSQGMSKSALKGYLEQLLRAIKFSQRVKQNKKPKRFSGDLDALLDYFPEEKKKLGNFKDKGKLYEVVEDLFLECNNDQINGLTWFLTVEENYALGLLKK